MADRTDYNTAVRLLRGSEKSNEPGLKKIMREESAPYFLRDIADSLAVISERSEKDRAG